MHPTHLFVPHEIDRGQDILYMMIVNMPTQAEMDEAMKLAGVESGQFEQDEGFVSRVTSEVGAMDIKK